MMLFDSIQCSLQFREHSIDPGNKIPICVLVGGRKRAILAGLLHQVEEVNERTETATGSL
jgi:hypothetical protein